VEISGFGWTNEWLDLVSMLFESSNSIKRVTLLTIAAKNIGSQSLKVTALPSSSMLMMDGVDPAVVDKELKSITCNSARGRWDIKEGVYTWTQEQRCMQADGSIPN